ncbi:MAG: hypothetical protein IPH57_14325 [Saprospiraceae bacterium]|nr:hypothetical protein [Saprospiraceae bacterium]
MKRLLLFIIAMYLFLGSSLAQITIGTGTLTQRQPFGCYFGYERSASIYTSSEIGVNGTITTLGWYVGTAYSTNIPTKIYLKTTTSSTLTSSTWATMISGATLVYDATRNYTPTGWLTIDIIDYTYPGDNLLVLCETNYGGGGTSSYPVFRYSTATSQHQYWYQDNSAPTGSGTVNSNRPNIQLNITTSACSGTPDPGNTISSANPVCPGVNFTLSLQNATPGSGVTYQWQSSPNGADPWTNIGTSTPTHTTSQTAATYYRCQVTCGTKTGTSNPILQGDPAPPTTQASAITTSALAYTTATITWTAGSGNRRYAVLNNVNSFTNPSGTGDVTVAGTAYSGSGEQIIYDGTGTSVSVTGLIANTTYYVRVYEYLRCTGTPNTNYYQTSTATNNPGSFTTLASPTCPGGLGTGTVNIPSLPYSATALTNCGNGNNITSTNVASVCGSSNYYTGEDKTFIFTPSSSGDYVFTLTSITTYTAMMLYNGCPFSASCVGNVQSSGSGTKTMTLSLTSGTTYYLVVDTWTAPTCIPSFDLSIAAATPPSCTTITTPADGATNVALAGNITFAAATGATSYDIYLSTSTPPAYHGNTTTTTYAYTGLSANTLYYVQIIPKNANGAASGCTITSFTTVPPPPANDNCAGATAFPTIPTDGTCASLSNQSTAGATQSQVACAGSGADDDVWFSFVAPATTIITEITAVSGSSDRVHEIFSGTCVPW